MEKISKGEREQGCENESSVCVCFKRKEKNQWEGVV